MLNKEMVLSLVASKSNEAKEINQDVFTELVEGLEESEAEEVLDIIIGNHFTVVEDEVAVPGDYNSTGSISGLTNEELCVMYQKGDNEAIGTLYTKNIRLLQKYANKIYKEYNPTSLDVEDLCGYGKFGIIKAAEKFDASLGFKFTTYATWWIRQAITREVMNSGYAIRVPIHFFERAIKVGRFVKNTGRRSIPEIQAFLKADCGKLYSEEEIKDLLGCNSKYLNIPSLNDPVGEEEGDAERGDFIAAENDPENEAIRKVDSEFLEQTLEEELTEKENDIIHRRFGLGNHDKETLEEVAAKYNVTRERIRQIEVKALGKLRKPSVIMKLEGMLAA